MPNIPDKLISAYLDGILDEQQAAELSQWVQASKEHARYIASLAILEHGLIKYTKMQSNSDILTEIQEPDGGEQPLQPIHIDAEALTKQRYVLALSYVLCHTLTPKRLIVGGVAAGLLLGAVLTAVLMIGSDSQPHIVETPDRHDTLMNTTTPVATLSAIHNAQWAERALARGSSLRPGQTLTLTAGFAEITTQDGAVAILEAPATVELLDNSNALRLHAGKLVGICETESSKGFVVRTSQMDITDLGTVFGVEAIENRTRASVFEGEIVVEHASSRIEEEPSVLTAGQSAQASDLSGIEPIANLDFASTFITGEELRLRRVAGGGSPYDRWLTATSDIKRMRGLVLYYPMNGLPDQADRISNQAASSFGEMDGLLGKAAGIGNDPKWVPGRFEGKKGLNFSAIPAACAIVRHDDRLNLSEALTLSAWVQIEFRNAVSISLLNKRTWCDGSSNFNWSVLSPSFNPDLFPPASLQLASGERVYTGTQAPENTLRHSDRDVVPEGEWVHLAVVADRQETRFYINGDLVTATQGQQLTINDADLLIGTSWDARPEDQKGVNPDRGFEGIIDEIAIFSVAMTAQEIQRLYALGTPPNESARSQGTP